MYLGLSVCEIRPRPVGPAYSTVVLEISWRHYSVFLIAASSWDSLVSFP